MRRILKLFDAGTKRLVFKKLKLLACSSSELGPNWICLSKLNLKPAEEEEL